MTEHELLEAVGGVDEELVERCRRKSVRVRSWGRRCVAAAAACAVLIGSTLALSPGLREQLAAALGGFGPYMQEIDEAVCVENGIEIKVISAVADSYMVRVYAEARDLEGDRLTADMGVFGFIDRKAEEEPEGGRGATGSAKCVGFDEETGTALLELDTWGDFSSDLGEMKLLIYSLDVPGNRIVGEHSWKIDLNVEVLSRREIALNGTVDGAELLEADISALGAMLVTKGAACLGARYVYSVYFKDGTVVHPYHSGGMGIGEDGPSYVYLKFDDPVDPDQVTGISVHYWMVPFDGDVAGEGYWLSELPE